MLGHPFELQGLLHYLIFILLIILILSACKVNGADGNGTKQGTCPDAGQICNIDGTCGTYFYHYYSLKYGSSF